MTDGVANARKSLGKFEFTSSMTQLKNILKDNPGRAPRLVHLCTTGVFDDANAAGDAEKPFSRGTTYIRQLDKRKFLEPLVLDWAGFDEDIAAKLSGLSVLRLFCLALGVDEADRISDRFGRTQLSFQRSALEMYQSHGFDISNARAALYTPAGSEKLEVNFQAFGAYELLPSDPAELEAHGGEYQALLHKKSGLRVRGAMCKIACDFSR